MSHIYIYMVCNFCGAKGQLLAFRRKADIKILVPIFFFFLLHIPYLRYCKLTQLLVNPSKKITSHKKGTNWHIHSFGFDCKSTSQLYISNFNKMGWVNL